MCRLENLLAMFASFQRHATELILNGWGDRVSDVVELFERVETGCCLVRHQPYLIEPGPFELSVLAGMKCEVLQSETGRVELLVDGERVVLESETAVAEAMMSLKPTET